MANNIRFYHLWDPKEIAKNLIILFSLVMILLTFFYFPQIVNFFKSYQYDSEVMGSVVKIVPHQNITHSMEGSKLTYDYFTISYSFTAQRQTYTNSEKIKIGKTEYLKLKEILNRDKHQVTIRYDSKNPKKSMIELYNEDNSLWQRGI